MIISIESGSDWTDASYALLDTALTAEQLDALHKEWSKLYLEADKRDNEAYKAAGGRVGSYMNFRMSRNLEGYTRCDGYTVVGCFNTWLVKNGHATTVETKVWGDWPSP